MAFSLSNLITTVENSITTTEADVYQWVLQIQSGLAVLNADLTSGLKWVAANAPTIVADLQGALALAQMVPGLQIPAAVVEAATAAAAGLQAVAAAENAGKSNAATLVSGYAAVVAATQAKAGVQLAVTSAPTPANTNTAPVAAAA